MPKSSSGRLLTKTLVTDNSCYDITALATVRVSSAARDNPSLYLVDDNLDTFWQSDDFYTHFINLDFPEKIPLSVWLCSMRWQYLYIIYLNFAIAEIISVR